MTTTKQKGKKEKEKKGDISNEVKRGTFLTRLDTASPNAWGITLYSLRCQCVTRLKR
jgi:hypothetical protein